MVYVLEVRILKEGDYKDKNLVAGIDEAGRGPVIGPLVIAGVMLRKSLIENLRDMGVRDSKMLSSKRRVELFDMIISLAESVVAVILPPRTIDFWVARHGLNKLEAKGVAKIIERFHVAEEIIIDSPSSAEKFRTYLHEFLGHDSGRIILEPKADRKYSIVGAASIIAKVIRDNEVRKIRDRLGIDFGSGYPSDPKTREALRDIIQKDPTVVRRSWLTVKKMANRSLDEFL